MVKIRLARKGAKNWPFYGVVATDSRTRRDGRFIEKLGYYNPLTKNEEEKILLKLDKIDQRVSQGAQISPRVKRLIKEYKKIKESTQKTE